MMEIKMRRIVKNAEYEKYLPKLDEEVKQTT